VSAQVDASSRELRQRVEDGIAHWRVAVDRLVETERAVLVLGRRDIQPVALKVMRNRGDEWRSAEVLMAFEGRGVVRVLDHIEGAMLLERLSTGESLVDLVDSGNDDLATGILADVIGRMSPRAPAIAMPTVEDWGQAFERHASCETHLLHSLVEDAQRIYGALCATQSRLRLLHGDLHHDNVLRDAERGWLAIDAKGVVGELEYEVGAALRNPYQRPDVFSAPTTIERRVERLARDLHLDAGRMLAWAYAQAVLATVWAVEDGAPVGPDHRWIATARTLRPMVRGVVDV
jgi:streptomycin 6-kinase